MMTTELKMKSIIRSSVAMITDELEDVELAVLNNTAQLNMDPRERLFDYEKVKVLFSENNGTQMHDETKEALAAIVNQRLA